MPMNEATDSYADQWAFIYNELGMSPERHLIIARAITTVSIYAAVNK